MYKHIGNSGKIKRNSLCGSKLYTKSVNAIEMSKDVRSGNAFRFRRVSLVANKNGTVLIPKTVGRPAVIYQCLLKI